MPDPIAPQLYRSLPQGLDTPSLVLRPARRGDQEPQNPRGGHWWRDLEAPATQALKDLIRWWPLQPPAHLSRHISRALASTPILNASDDGLEVIATALCDAAQEVDPDGIWLAAQGECTPAGLRALRLQAIFPPGVLPEGPPRSPPLVRVTVRTLGHRATDEDLAAFAGRLRAALLAESPPSVEALEDDATILAAFRPPEDPHLESETVARAWAYATRVERLDLLEGHESPHPAVAAAAPNPGDIVEAGRASRADALEALLAFAAIPVGDAPLLCAAVAVDADWTVPAGLSKVPGLGAAVAALLPERDWLDFDAPGEGELPSLWRDALVLAGLWDVEWTKRWAELGAPAPETTDPFDLLLGYPIPTGQASASMLSSYSHGLHDGTAESYGGVYSPHDPFSDRNE